MRRLKFLLAFATMLSALMSFGVLNFGGAAPAGASSKVTLTLWDNYGGDNEAVATAALTKAFTKLHPNITFNIVSQPGTNYFALLSAAAISGTGPDLAVEWTGQFDLLRQSYELNLKSYLSASEVASINGASYAALDFNTSKGLLVVPYDHDSYIGYYNKSLFAKAGIKSIPDDWSQLFADCSTLKAAGHSADGVRQHRRTRLGRRVLPLVRHDLPHRGRVSAQRIHQLVFGQTLVDVADD